MEIKNFEEYSINEGFKDSVLKVWDEIRDRSYDMYVVARILAKFGFKIPDYVKNIIKMTDEKEIQMYKRKFDKEVDDFINIFKHPNFGMKRALDEIKDKIYNLSQASMSVKNESIRIMRFDEMQYSESMIKKIHDYIKNKDVKTLGTMLERGLDPNFNCSKDYRGLLLNMATEVSDNLEMVKMLVKYGADPSLRNFSTFKIALDSSNFEEIKFLAEAIKSKISIQQKKLLCDSLEYWNKLKPSKTDGFTETISHVKELFGIK